MKNRGYNPHPFMKDFYRISKERLEAYLNKLGEGSDIIREIRLDLDEGNVDWEKVDEAWGKVIDVYNSLLGFRYYEDTEVGGEIVDDAYLFNQDWNQTELDNGKFHDIEFGKSKNK